MRFERVAEDGLEYLIARPASGGVGAPVLMGLHGRGAGPEDFEALAPELGENLIHVLPRAPHPDGAGHAWFGQGDARPATLAASREALAALLAKLRRTLGAGPERTAVWGFSQGGVMALELGLRSPSPLAGVVSAGGYLDARTGEDRGVLRQARERDFLLVHGVRDPVVPHTRSREAYVLLMSQGARVELAELPMAHELTPLAVGAMRGFLGATLGKSATPAQA